MPKRLTLNRKYVKENALTWGVLLFILIFGAFLRFYQLSAAPYWMDEGYTINAVLSVEARGSTILDSGQNYSCPLYCYPTATLARTIGSSALAFRFESALAGIAFVLVFFFIMYALFNKRVALLASAFSTFSYFQIAWSRQARWYTLFELFFWLALFCFYQTLHAKDRGRMIWYGTATLLTTALACLAHGLGYLLPLIFLAWFVLDRLWLHANASRKHLPAVIGAAAVLAIVAFVFDRQLIVSEITGFSLHYELPRYLLFYARSYWLLIIPGILYLLFADRPYKEETGFLLFVFGAYLFALSFLTGIVQYRYLFQLTPVFFILAALGIFEVTKRISHRPLQWLAITAILGLFFATSEGVWRPQTQYFLESDPSGQSGYDVYVPQPDWNAAYGYISVHLNSQDIVISSMPQFNNVFLHQSGYWIEYDYYVGMPNASNIVRSGREYYANAIVIPDLAMLQQLMTTQHGFIVLDYYATDQRIAPDILAYIEAHAQQVFYQYTNPYSQVWVYQF